MTQPAASAPPAPPPQSWSVLRIAIDRRTAVGAVLLLSALLCFVAGQRNEWALGAGDLRGGLAAPAVFLVLLPLAWSVLSAGAAFFVLVRSGAAVDSAPGAQLVPLSDEVSPGARSFWQVVYWAALFSSVVVVVFGALLLALSLLFALQPGPDATPVLVTF